MKKSLLIILLSVVLLGLPACHTTKKETTEIKIEQEATTWKNVSVPVRLDLSEPKKMSVSGRMIMVRGEYCLISLRMLGFEVAQIYVNPEEADIVVKQINKIWIQEPIENRLQDLKIPFTTLQEALLANKAALDRLPSGLDLSLSGSEERPVLTLKLTPKGKTFQGSMTLSMNEAQWDQPRVMDFIAPKGDEYKKVSLKELATILK